MSASMFLLAVFALMLVTAAHAQVYGIANYQTKSPCPFQGQKVSKYSTSVNSYFTGLTGQFGQNEYDIGVAFPQQQPSCNFSAVPLKDFLQVTGNTNSFCNGIGNPSGKGGDAGAQPPYNLQLTTTSSFQPSSLTPFGRETGFGRKLQQNFAQCGRGASFGNIISQYGAKQSTQFPNLYYSVNMGSGAAAGYTLFGVHTFGLGNCRSDVLVLDNWLLFEPYITLGPVCTAAGINAQG